MERRRRRSDNLAPGAPQGWKKGKEQPVASGRGLTEIGLLLLLSGNGMDAATSTLPSLSSPSWRV